MGKVFIWNLGDRWYHKVIMETSYDCISCFFRQTELLFSLKRLPLEKRKEFLQNLTHSLLRHNFRNPPVVFGRYIYKSFSKISGIQDPFKEKKLRIERFLEKIIKELRLRNINSVWKNSLNQVISGGIFYR